MNDTAQTPGLSALATPEQLSTFGVADQGAFNSMVSNFVNQNLGNPQAIADAAKQFGVSSQQIQAATGYTPEQQAQYFSGTGFSVPGLSATETPYENLQPGGLNAAGQAQEAAPPPMYGNQNQFSADVVQSFVNANLQDPGAIARRMQETGVTQADLGNIFQGTYTPEQIANYFAQPSAKLYATSYDGGSSPLTAKESFDYILANLDDPTRLTQAAISRGFTPQELLDITRMYAPQYAPELANITQENVDQYLAKGREGFNTEFGKIAQDVFGSSDEINFLADQAYNSYRRRIEADKTLSAAEKQALLGKSRDEYIAETYGPQAYADQSLEDIEKSLRESGINKYQEALRLRNISMGILGYTEEEANELYNKALAGSGLSEEEQTIYDKLLQSHRVSQSDYDALMTYAAVNAPDSPVFKDDPELLQLYTPLPGVIQATSDTKWGGGSGQYGYYNGAPILNAEVANSIVGQHGSTRNLNAGGVNYSDIAKTLGFDFAAHEQTTAFRAGNSVFGIDFDRDYLQDLERLERGEILGNFDPDTGRMQFSERVVNPKYGSVDSEGNPEPQYIYRPVDALTVPESSRFGGAQMPTTLEEAQQKLNTAAEKLGIDPTGKDLETLFDEVTDRSAGFYQIMGQSAGIQPEANPEGRNHVAAMYRQVGDKLIPVDLNFFHADAPKKAKFGPFGGKFAEIAQDIASIPFVAEAALFIPGAQAYYPAIKAAQAAALGADFDDIAKAYVKSAVMQSVVQTVSPMLQTQIAQIPGMTELASASPEVANFIIKAGADATISMGMAAISGQDVEEAGIAALITSGVFKVTDTGVQMAEVPAQYRPAVTRILTDLIMERDMKNSLVNVAASTIRENARREEAARAATQSGQTVGTA